MEVKSNVDSSFDMFKELIKFSSASNPKAQKCLRRETDTKKKAQLLPPVINADSSRNSVSHSPLKFLKSAY